MGLTFSNNSEGTLANILTAGATSLTLTPGHGSRFPEVDFAADGDYFFATLVAQDGTREVIKVKEHTTAVDIDQFSIIERAADAIQSGVATAYAFAAADKVQLRLPAVAILSQDGTKSDTFQIDTDNTGITLKHDTQELLVRNLADSAYANLKANGLTLADALVISGTVTGVTSLTMAGALSGVTTLAMGGALSGVTTLAMGGALTGATDITASGTVTAADVTTTDDIVCGDDLTVNGKLTATAEAAAISIDNEASIAKIKARDHQTASTPEVPNMVYGTGSPPAAGTVPQGTIWLKYV